MSAFEAECFFKPMNTQSFFYLDLKINISLYKYTFAMNNWYKQAALFVIIISGTIVTAISGINAQEIKIISNINYLKETDKKQSRLLAQRSLSCPKIDSAYQEVYSFETENYYISICQLENSFLYHRISKLDEQNAVLIPAQAVFGGDAFEATDGRTTYFVGVDGDRYYSSVMQNNNEIVFEPELQQPLPKLSRETRRAVPDLSVSRLRLNNYSRNAEQASVELDNPENNAERSSICTSDKSAFNPHLDGWQKLIGKSPDTANKYALNNGHNFVYDDNAPDKALIKTKEGSMINLNIAIPSETIDRVCVQPLAEKK